MTRLKKNYTCPVKKVKTCWKEVWNWWGSQNCFYALWCQWSKTSFKKDLYVTRIIVHCLCESFSKTASGNWH